MGRRTPLYDTHVGLGAKIVDFGGWDMPLHYGSQIDEHHKVRQDAGMFDVSHMTVSDLRGARVRECLRRLLANDVAKLTTQGRALYSCMLNERGGVIDDVIVYFFSETWFRMVSNAATREKDLVWIAKLAADFDVEIKERGDLAMIAIQGPNARAKTCAVVGDDATGRAAAALKPFHSISAGNMMLATTGYTGEDGFEIILPVGESAGLWKKLLEAGVSPAGLGARDTLRLEAGMNLYGSDMDESTSPLESGLGWTVAFDPEERDFIGRRALENQRRLGLKRRLVGLVMEGKGVLRNHQSLACEDGGRGEITSGSFSPTLGQSIALARVPAALRIGAGCRVELRGKWVDVRIVKYPFVRHGKSCLH